MTQMARPFEKELAYSGGMKFADMTRKQKFVFVAKLAVCVGTFGFVFPNVQNE